MLILCDDVAYFAYVEQLTKVLRFMVESANIKSLIS